MKSSNMLSSNGLVRFFPKSQARPVLLALLLAVASPASAGSVRVEGKSEAVIVEGRAGRAMLMLPSETVPISLTSPCQTCILQTARLIGERPGTAWILVMTYDSRPGTPGGMCGAGQEELLKVVRSRPEPQEVLTVVLSSCWDNVDALGDPSWDAGRGLLVAERWTLADTEKPERLGWIVGNDGKITDVDPTASSP